MKSELNYLLSSMRQQYKSAKKVAVMPDQSQADIYLQLSRLEEAGMETFQAVELLQKIANKNLNHVYQFKKYLQLGDSIVEAGVKSGLFRPNDYDLLHMAEVSGHLSSVYKKLANQYGLRAQRIKKIKSQCYLPMAMLVIAIFIKPLPALILSEISLLQYLSTSFGLLIKIIAIVFVVFQLPRWLTTGGLKFLGLGNTVLKAQLQIPWFSGLIKAKQINEFVQSLGLLLQAGMPIVEALPKAINTIKNPYLKQQFDTVGLSVSAGGSLANGLTDVKDMDGHLKHQILAAEQSGQLAKSLLHCAEIEDQNIDLKQQMLAEWLPRLFYFIVAIWIAFSIIGTQSFQPPAI